MAYLSKICSVFASLLCVVNMDDMGWLFLLQVLGLHPKVGLFVRIPETGRELIPAWQAWLRWPQRCRCWPRRRRRLGCRCCCGCGQSVDKLWLEDGLVDAGEGGLEGEVETQAGRY